MGGNLAQFARGVLQRWLDSGCWFLRMAFLIRTFKYIDLSLASSQSLLKNLSILAKHVKKKLA